jgi:hypothetical protein
MPVKSNIKLILYHTSNCGHCKAFEESGVWEELKNKFKDIEFIALKDKDVPEDITGVPTIKIFKVSEEKEYSGARTKEAISKWISDFKEGKVKDSKNKQDSESESLEEQCGGGSNKEEFYKMKYYKYKAKYIYMKSKYN